MAAPVGVHVVAGGLPPPAEALRRSHQRPSDLRSLTHLLSGASQKTCPEGWSDAESRVPRTRARPSVTSRAGDHDAGVEAHEHLRLSDRARHNCFASFNGERNEVYFITLPFAVIKTSPSGRIHLAGRIPFAFLCLGECAFLFSFFLIPRPPGLSLQGTAPVSRPPGAWVRFRRRSGAVSCSAAGKHEPLSSRVSRSPTLGPVWPSPEACRSLSAGGTSSGIRCPDRGTRGRLLTRVTAADRGPGRRAPAWERPASAATDLPVGGCRAGDSSEARTSGG